MNVEEKIHRAADALLESPLVDAENQSLFDPITLRLRFFIIRLNGEITATFVNLRGVHGLVDKRAAFAGVIVVILSAYLVLSKGNSAAPSS